MRQDPFPSPGNDGEEPDGPVPTPVTGNGPGTGDPDGPAPPPGSGDERPGDDPNASAGTEQGLFVCLPAEDLDVSRFTQHGRSDSMPPGPLLASVVHALTGEDGESLAALSDDQLVGIIAAGRRLESRIAWTQLAALAEFAAAVPPTLQAGTAAALGPGRR